MCLARFITQVFTKVGKIPSSFKCLFRYEHSTGFKHDQGRYSVNMHTNGCEYAVIGLQICAIQVF